MSSMAHSFYVSRIDCTLRLHRRYSLEEVEVARHKARTWRSRWDYTEQVDVNDAWSVAHVLTSNTVWGIGRINKVDQALMHDVRDFFADLLASTEPDDLLRTTPSVVGFVVTYINNAAEASFTALLRAYIYGFRPTIDRPIDVNTSLSVSHNALQMAADHDAVPIFVLKTLLEAGARVDLANDNGDTPMMLCVEKFSCASAAKLSHLIDYGANIDRFNLCFQNAIHVAVVAGNTEALSVLLAERLRRMNKIPLAEEKAEEYTFRRREALDPDPLHAKDELHETPVAILHRSVGMSHNTRAEILDILLGAGAVADSDIDQDSHATLARNACTEMASFGMVNCQPFEGFLMFFSVHKPAYETSMDITTDLDTLCISVDKAKSVLPPASMAAFDIKTLFMDCTGQRFDFSGDIDGIDFDVHFNVCDYTGQQTEIVGRNDGGDYKLAIRFPRGPCPLEYWSDDPDYFPLLLCNMTVDKKYTLAHYAAATPCPAFRSRMLSVARPLCNPLVRCSKGLTAAETLQQKLQGGAIRWDVKRLLASMQRDQNTMTAYIHRDALMLLVEGGRMPKRRSVEGGAVSKTHKKTNTAKRAASKSPFHSLSDDVCRHILSFI
ncbi:hypothetical protein T484DRAFT_1755854 [Baffinella frigidus]|nr:hypothetical protein T484DRAFT_1755854 [Cryptophyta sp. CCMP2293]